MVKRLSPAHSLLLAAFLALALLGAQALKNSPWHDHSHHVIDCALCHLQAAEAEPPAKGLPLPLFALAGRLLASDVRLSPSLFQPSYRSRAPPLHRPSR